MLHRHITPLSVVEARKSAAPSLATKGAEGGGAGASKATIVKKLLLLGLGGVGKSTVFKQIRQLHSSTFSDKERAESHLAIVNQMVRAIRKLIVEGNRENLFELSSAIEHNYEKLEELGEITSIKNEETMGVIREILTALWSLDEVLITTNITTDFDTSYA